MGLGAAWGGRLPCKKNDRTVQFRLDPLLFWFDRQKSSASNRKSQRIELRQSHGG